jgi:hypothetical protein
MSVTIAYDVTSANYEHAPKGQQLALYVTGSKGVQATPGQLAAHPDAVLIDQTPASGKWDATADVDDYENGAVRLNELAGRAKSRIASFRAQHRVGQRTPVVYFSAVNIHLVVNALVTGGVKSGVGLFVANWGVAAAEAAAEVTAGSGPFPVVGFQFKNAGLFDIDVFSTAWLENRSGHVVPGAMPAPPGQWNPGSGWEWKSSSVAGVGLDGKAHTFFMDVVNKRWNKTS